MSTPYLVLACFFGYFALLLVIAWYTTRQRETLSDFFLASRRAPWYVVAYGMVGTSISGVTFISVPGAVGTQAMGYFQVVLGYLAGYVVIMYVLLPLYYRLQLTSIYTYLQQRLGYWGYKTGAAYFLLSRSLGASVRTYLMALVLQYLVADAFGIPFGVTVAVILGQILLYTGRGGMKTILWTDTLQSTCLIGAVLVTVVTVAQALGVHDLWQTVANAPQGRVFFFDDWRAPNYFWKEFLSGAFICIVMTGLDQSQMQKNLACRNLREARWNMGSFSIAMALVNLGFLTLGVLLWQYVAAKGIAAPAKTDQLYPMLAFDHFGPVVAVLFMLGLTAAAYSSADDALTALTTSFTVDILNIERMPEARALRTKRLVHLGMALLLFVQVMAFRASEAWQTGNFSVIALVLKLAVYTYGPLLGMFAFGIFTRRRVHDQWLPLICTLAPLVCLLLEWNAPGWLGFSFGNALILLNGALVFGGMWLASVPGPVVVASPLAEPLRAA